jgi:hypothetical protein
MGLNLLVGACAKPGHEAEWRALVERNFADDEVTEAELDRFDEISIPGYEQVGAPRVGFDAAADAWIIKVRNATTPEQVAAVLEECHGDYALGLVQCDGIPHYSNVGAGAVDETSFCGSWLRNCTDVLETGLLETAWNHMWPAEAVAYGEALLAAADRSEGRKSPLALRALQRMLNKIGLDKASSDTPLVEQLDIVRAAGRWYIFWGERGHYIEAWY